MLECKHCKEIIQVKETKVREITAYNKTFIDKINKLVK